MKGILKVLIPFVFQDRKIIFWYRVGKELRKRRLDRSAIFVEAFILQRYSCHISTQARIHPSVKFPHPVGIVIGSGVVIDKGVVIYQNVTLGRISIDVDEYPIIGEGVCIYCNSVVVGSVKLSPGYVVKAGSIVKNSVMKNGRQEIYGAS